MARIRSLKPEFWSTPDHAGASPWVRLLYMAMWNWADDAGRGTASARELWGFAFGIDGDDVAPTVSELPTLLTEVQCRYGVTFYKVSGRPYYAIPSWAKHQRNERLAQSKYPAPQEGVEYSPTGPDLRRDGDTRKLRRSSSEDVGSSDDSDGSSGPVVGEQGNRGTGEQGHEQTRAIVATRSETAVAAPDGAGPFDEFWAAYPSKKGKADALKAWRTGKCARIAEQVIAGAARYRDDPNRDPAYTKLPAGWLRDGRWDDDPLPARSGQSKQQTEQAATDDFFERAMRRAQDAEAAQLALHDRSSA